MFSGADECSRQNSDEMLTLKIPLHTYYRSTLLSNTPVHVDQMPFLERALSKTNLVIAICLTTCHCYVAQSSANAFQW